MKVNLFDGINPLSITEKQGIIMKKIAKEILDHLSIVYNINEIRSMNFHIKGIEKITSLQIIISLKFIESDDVIDVIVNKMSKVVARNSIGGVPRDDDPGLSFMTMYKKSIMDSLSLDGRDASSEINFWYQFTNEEVLKWNGNHIYSFDMF